MEQEKKSMASKIKSKLIHVQIVDGSQADVYEIGEFLKQYTENAKEELGYDLKAIITNDRITLRDVDAMIKELWKLKKQIDQNESMSNM